MIARRHLGVTLSEREARIDAAQEFVRASFAVIGSELAAIRDAELYRHQYVTFDAYCRERWGFNRQRAGQLIEAAAAIAPVAKSFGQPVATDSQARQLGRLPLEDRADVWNGAVDETKRTGEARRLGPTIDELRSKVDRKLGLPGRVADAANLRAPSPPPKREPHHLVTVLRLNLGEVTQSTGSDLHPDDATELGELVRAWSTQLARLIKELP